MSKALSTSSHYSSQGHQLFIFITAPRHWNDLPPERRTFLFLLHHWKNHPSSSSNMVFHSVYRTYGFPLKIEESSLQDLIPWLIWSYPILPLNYTRLNSYSVSSEPLTTGPKPSMGYPLDNPSDLTQHSRINWCPALGVWVVLEKFGHYDCDIIETP